MSIMWPDHTIRPTVVAWLLMGQSSRGWKPLSRLSSDVHDGCGLTLRDTTVLTQLFWGDRLKPAASKLGHVFRGNSSVS